MKSVSSHRRSAGWARQCEPGPRLSGQRRDSSPDRSSPRNPTRIPRSATRPTATSLSPAATCTQITQLTYVRTRPTLDSGPNGTTLTTQGPNLETPRNRRSGHGGVGYAHGGRAERLDARARPGARPGSAAGPARARPRAGAAVGELGASRRRHFGALHSGGACRTGPRSCAGSAAPETTPATATPAEDTPSSRGRQGTRRSANGGKAAPSEKARSTPVDSVNPLSVLSGVGPLVQGLRDRAADAAPPIAVAALALLTLALTSGAFLVVAARRAGAWRT